MKLTLIQEFMEFWRTQVIPVRQERDETYHEETTSKIIFAITLTWGILVFGAVLVLALVLSNPWLLFLWVPWLIILLILSKFEGWYYRTHGCRWGR